jgi:hypothetical protein
MVGIDTVLSGLAVRFEEPPSRRPSPSGRGNK